jgi:metal-sulfur cluster biosynthetic enzyme
MNEITNDKDKCTIALEQLHDVIDPEIGLNIVDLGLIYQIDFDEKGKVIYCTMTLTTQFCPMGESISDGTKSCLENTFEGYDVTVNLTFDPPWSAEKISPEGQEFLN